MNRLLLIVGLSILSAASVARAEVRLPSIFSDHMVLQRGQKVPIWGTADAGEKVTVTIGNVTAAGVAGADGKWSVTLNSLLESDKPVTMSIAGKNTVILRDVVVGDVWVCSGQSNMEYDLNSVHNWSTEIPKANHPSIRFFVVAKNAALEPQSNCVGRWEVCEPETASRFSALAYFFGREIMNDQNVPIGLVGSYWGGTRAQAWTSLNGLKSRPELQHLVQLIETTKANLPALRSEYERSLAMHAEAHEKWEQDVQPAHGEAMKQWTAAAAQARVKGQLPPPRPRPLKPEPRKPLSPDHNAQLPSVLANGMIAPIVPYAIKGVIWYQGEQNADESKLYRTLLPTLVTDWRANWDQGDFPFIWVQLPNCYDRLQEPTQSSTGWPELREAQSMALHLPNTGQAVTIDVGEVDIHPKNKLDVAYRVALVAKRVAYNRSLVHSGPTYDSMNVEADRIRLSFKNIGSGLMIGAGPAVRADEPPPVLLPTLKGFAVAGEDRKFVWADATIDGDTVLVSAHGVKPVAVRYAWANNPECNLYNKEKLPASPFRTDNWDDPLTPRTAR